MPSLCTRKISSAKVQLYYNVIRIYLILERLHNVYGGKNLWNWTKPTETSRISVVRDVADRFWGWQQLTNYRDPENKSGAFAGLFLVCSSTGWLQLWKPGKHGNLREFVNSGKLRENSGNFKFTQGICMILSLGHRVMCIIVSNSSVNWLGDTVIEPVTMLIQ